MLVHGTKGILTRTMELCIISMWYMSSVSINSCDTVETSSNAVSTLHDSLWLVGTSWIWLELARSSLSVQGIKGNHMV